MMLKAVNIKKNFDLDKTKLQILKGIDINIQVGEFVSIMGKSG